jgi:hypothetical protein
MRIEPVELTILGVAVGAGVFLVRWLIPQPLWSQWLILLLIAVALAGVQLIFVWRRSKPPRQASAPRSEALHRPFDRELDWKWTGLARPTADEPGMLAATGEQHKPADPNTRPGEQHAASQDNSNRMV